VDSYAHRLGSEETPHFLQEAGEGRFIFQDQVVAARQRDEPGSRDSRGEAPALVKRYNGVVARVHHQCRGRHLGRQRAHIKIIDRDTEANRIVRDIEIRCSSLNQSDCSLVPPGMNCAVKS
jgi:hypothetical protein